MQYEHDDGIRSTTRRARVVKVDDSKSQQRIDLKGLKNEKPMKIWRPQDFGYSSNPPKDCDGCMVQMGSRSDRTLYLDGGHEKYRPKNTPEGGTVLFNHTGDIIRVFKDKMDAVHAKTINIRIGHGYNAGDNGEGQGSPTANGQPDDASGKDTKTISVVLTGDSIVVTYDDSSVKLQSGQITHTSPKIVLEGEVHLGGDGGVLVRRCDDSCATKVFAV
ncbi:phage baseplate assembly protein [Bradyrhizobium tropiciagri]|uniref:phage baseplate assembly protein domain-containing protein n=1 Tax=Bradyrhizobium tropiciagri TaxID=312253 RepID=UPI001BAC6779|nr:phage baseplate assembly protein [Bradyrhizobium tropiciagri]MBR0871206.1 phage baseplate assembly protein [Bradyrhizobium tropiciagri]